MIYNEYTKTNDMDQIHLWLQIIVIILVFDYKLTLLDAWFQTENICCLNFLLINCKTENRETE